MRSYKRVVKERYDRQQYDGKSIKKNLYSLINPVGFYGELKAAQILKDFVNLLYEKRGRSLDKLRVCDCGCGFGTNTRVLAELFANPDQVCGMEYSKNSLEFCKMMNPAIHYEWGDLTVAGAGLPFDEQFDGITAFVVLMHFATDKEILSALENIYVSIKKGGYFLWYDLDAKSHKEGKSKDIDHWGFSKNEMDQYAKKVGFRLVYESGIYTKIPFLKQPMIYLAEKIKDIGMLELLEKLPFKKNNLIRIYVKEA